MSELVLQTRHFADVTTRVLDEMFAVDTTRCSAIRQASSLETGKSFIVSIFFTGTVYGEYLLAMEPVTAAQLIGVECEVFEADPKQYRDDVSDAVSEMLNTVVGETIVSLQESHSKLTLTTPRIYCGEVRYPQFDTATATLSTSAGEIECHFYLDLMRLDLAESYQQAMESLLQVNAKLRQANCKLAEQQTQLVHTEKMASVGILASGVAHEINNPLFFVDANLTTMNDYIKVVEASLRLFEQLFHCDVNDELVSRVEAAKAECRQCDLEFVMEDTMQLLDESRAGVQRIKEIVQGLRDFSQINHSGRTEADINLIVHNTCDLVANQLGEACRLETDLGDVPRVICNAAEIGQVIFSLMLNAREAIEAGGVVRMKTYAQEDAVMIVVEDNGAGIASDDLEHIFEPFFTTKAEGEGSGLGLSIAYGIVRGHQGSICVSSEVGQGTSVTVRLPRQLEVCSNS